MSKNRITSQNKIKESRKGLVSTNQKVVSTGFTVKYDKEYPVNYVLYGDVEITVEKIVDNEKISKIIFSGRRVVTSNVNRELIRVKALYGSLVKDGFKPGIVSISNCNVSCPAAITDEFK